MGADDIIDGRARRLARRHGLTHRERQVLALLGRGNSNREIASRLGIGMSTVKSHVTGVLGKLHVARRSQLMPLFLDS